MTTLGQADSVSFPLLQVNCETDFVARNDEFHSLVSLVADTVISKADTRPPLSPTVSLQRLTSEHLSSLVPTTTSKSYPSLADLVAENIGLFSENIALKRGLVMSASLGQLCSYTYNGKTDPETGATMGTYASLVHLLPSEGGEFKLDREKVEKVGRKVGQHIVGKAPTMVYPTGSCGCDGDGESDALVEQRYLLDDTVTVGEWLKSHDTQVTSFIRFALGEL